MTEEMKEMSASDRKLFKQMAYEMNDWLFESTVEKLSKYLGTPERGEQPGYALFPESKSTGKRLMASGFCWGNDDGKHYLAAIPDLIFEMYGVRLPEDLAGGFPMPYEGRSYDQSHLYRAALALGVELGHGWAEERYTSLVHDTVDFERAAKVISDLMDEDEASGVEVGIRPSLEHTTVSGRIWWEITEKGVSFEVRRPAGPCITGFCSWGEEPHFLEVTPEACGRHLEAATWVLEPLGHKELVRDMFRRCSLAQLDDYIRLRGGDPNTYAAELWRALSEEDKT